MKLQLVLHDFVVMIKRIEIKVWIKISHYHHLITELVIERIGEEARHRGQAVDHVEGQAAVVTQHHQ